MNTIARKKASGLLLMPVLLSIIVVCNKPIETTTREGFVQHGIVFAAGNSPVERCLVRVTHQHGCIDSLTNAEGRFVVELADSALSGVTGVELIAVGYTQKKVQPGLSAATMDTFYLVKNALAVIDTAAVFFASIPPDAFVLQDSFCIGLTNRQECCFSAGV